MNRNMALEFVRATEAAAIASARLMGRGKSDAADQAAVDSMRSMLGSIDTDATIVIGEGERDEAPMLYIGEKVGTGQGPKLEIAVDPLEGTSLCATGAPNSLSVMAIGEEGCLMRAPDTYMNKIAVGPEGRGAIDIREPASENLKRLAKVKNCRVQDLTAIILERDRHQELIQEVRESGARIVLIGDGDVSAAIATCNPESGVDILFGIGGAPEGVIAAAALRCIGGDFQGEFRFRHDEERQRAVQMGVTKLDGVLTLEDLARGNVLFCATGVTDGNYLDGVKFKSWGCSTHSIVMRSESGTIREIRAEHHFDKKPRY